MHQKRWQGFLNKKKAILHISFEETIDLIRVFTCPFIEGVKKIMGL